MKSNFGQKKIGHCPSCLLSMAAIALQGKHDLTCIFNDHMF